MPEHSSPGWDVFKFRNQHFDSIYEQLDDKYPLVYWNAREFNLRDHEHSPPYIYLLCLAHIQLLGIEDFEIFIKTGAKKMVFKFLKT